MRNILRSRNMVVAGASFALIAGMTGASIALSSGPAGATACGTPNISTCTATGTLTVTPGNLTFTTPASLAWTSLLNGLGQSVVDTRPGDQVATVDDASGTQAGWRVSVTATTFTNSAFATNNTLPDIGTFSVNGEPVTITAPWPKACEAMKTSSPTSTTILPVEAAAVAAAGIGVPASVALTTAAKASP